MGGNTAAHCSGSNDPNFINPISHQLLLFFYLTQRRKGAKTQSKYYFSEVDIVFPNNFGLVKIVG
jgi:hypothetical protein